MAEKYDTVAERVKKAMPTIEKMADMAAARAAWVEQPLPLDGASRASERHHCAARGVKGLEAHVDALMLMPA